MKLILLTMPDFFIEEHQILTALFDEGLELLHLRKPDSESVYLERLLTLIPETYRKRIVLHDHFYLKSEYNLAGIHLNNRNPLPPQNYKGQVSRSCHSAEEVLQYKKKTVTISSFRPSSTAYQKKAINPIFRQMSSLCWQRKRWSTKRSWHWAA